MHQPTSQPRPSLYYRYQVHQPWLPAPGGPAQRTPVAIVGAGPAGLVTALELARHGVKSVVLTSELQVSQGSRAIVFTRRSMEILQQVGVAARIVEAGLPWRFGNSYYRGQRVFRMEAPHSNDDRFFPMTNIQQQYLEEYLLDACKAQPLIELRWGNHVVQVEQSAAAAASGVAAEVATDVATDVAAEVAADVEAEMAAKMAAEVAADLKADVRVEVDTPAGLYTLQADWLVAADGGRSAIRTLLNLKLEGASYEGSFVIADIRINLPLPTERLAYFDPEWNPGNTVLLHREPHGIWRVDYQLPAGETAEEALQPASMKQRIDAQLSMIGHAGVPWQMDWCSVYSARTLTLASYVHGRVLFTGDAAHLLPIFGVRGANTAFQDAQSLGWQLAFVIKGLAGPQLLANHSAERVGAAREIIDEAGKSTRFMTPPSRGFRLLRQAVLSLSLSQDFVRPLFHWRTSRPHVYTRSALNCADDDNERFVEGPGHGAPPRNVRLGDDNFLLDHLGGGFDLLFFTDAAALPQSVQQAVAAARTRGVPLRVVAVGAVQPVVGADLTLADASGHCRRCYGVQASGAAYLLRPDQHVCARWLKLDGPRLQSALNTALPD